MSTSWQSHDRLDPFEWNTDSGGTESVGQLLVWLDPVQPRTPGGHELVGQAHSPLPRMVVVAKRVALVALFASLFACVDESRDGRPDDPLDVRYAAVLAGVADGAEWNDVQLDIQRAQERRKGECMRERGFDYRDRPVELRITVGPPLLTTEPTYARQFGFGLSQPMPSSVSAIDDPNSSRYEALTGASQMAWSGAEVECETSAVEITWDSDGLTAVNSLFDEVEGRVRSSPDVLGAQTEWKACLQRAGYTFTGSSWDDLANEYATRWERTDRDDVGAVAAFRREEVAVASAASDCATPMWATINDVRMAVVVALEPDLAAAVFD